MPPSPIRTDGRPTRFARPPLAGSAVLEGVVLCTAQAVSVAVRRPSGEVVSRVRPRRVRPWLKLARRVLGVRGVVALLEGCAIYGAAFWFALCQANLFVPLVAAAVGSQALPGSAPNPRRRWRTWRMLLAWLFWAALGAVLVLGGVPLIFTELAKDVPALWGAPAQALQLCCRGAGAVASVLLMTGYVTLVGHSSSLSVLFAYHGAEHQVRAAYDAGAPLTLQQVRRFAATDPACAMGRAVLLVLLGFAMTALLGALVRPLGAVLAAADGSWAHLLGAASVRALGVILAAGPYGELRRLMRRLQVGPGHPLMDGPGSFVCGASITQPSKEQTEVALVALLRLLDAQNASLQRGYRAPATFAKLADACVRLAEPNPHDRRGPRCEGDARCETN